MHSEENVSAPHLLQVAKFLLDAFNWADIQLGTSSFREMGSKWTNNIYKMPINFQTCEPSLSVYQRTILPMVHTHDPSASLLSLSTYHPTSGPHTRVHQPLRTIKSWFRSTVNVFYPPTGMFACYLPTSSFPYKGHPSPCLPTTHLRQIPRPALQGSTSPSALSTVPVILATNKTASFYMKHTRVM